MKTVLVPTDFSRLAQRAADRAIRLGSAGVRRIHLVHVHQAPRFGVPISRAGVAGMLAKECTRLERQVIRGGISRTSITTHLLKGEPYVEIIRQTRELEADVIVLGCKGAGQRPKKVLGRTAARVARMAEAPVLVVRRNAAAQYCRPLVALPLDPSASRLVRLAQAASDPSALPLSVVRAYWVPFPGIIDAGTDAEPSPHHIEMRARAEQEIGMLLKSLERKGVRVRAQLRWGDARSVILSEAASMRADLVVLGTHGRSGLAHMLLGSVAEWVLVNARADVLVARPVRFTFEIP